MHVIGVALTIFAGGFWMLFAGTLAIGPGNGLVEAAVNPLTATIYPDRKTEKLNALHVWFPGGIVIGGLAAFALRRASLNWQVKMAVILIPTVVYGRSSGPKVPADRARAARRLDRRNVP